MNNDYVSFLRPVRTVAMILFAALAALVIIFSISHIRTWSVPVDPTLAQISVSGEGEVFAVPDIATFSFTVQEEAKTVKQAQDKATAKTNAAVDYLKKSQIADKDIKTISYNANPRYEYEQAACTAYRCPPGKQVLVGYQVSQTIQVKVRNTEKAGTVLAGIGDLNVQYVSGLEFTIDDEESIRSQAREKAIADAKAKAQVLAKTLGVKLVNVIGFEEGTGGMPYYGGREYSMNQAKGAADAVAPAPSVPSGENKYTSNVTIIYGIK